jgi:hypothetical protein
VGSTGCRTGRELPIWVALNRQTETTHLIEWLGAAWDKPCSGKVHATIVGLDEATQAEYSGKLPTLEQMIRNAWGDQQVIRRAMQPTLYAWLPPIRAAQYRTAPVSVAWTSIHRLRRTNRHGAAGPGNDEIVQLEIGQSE